MKNKAEIILDLENQILPRLEKIKSLQAEVDALQGTVLSLRKLDGEIPELPKQTTHIDYAGYPANGTLLEKYQYLEDKTLRVWTNNQMGNLIQQIEGLEQAAITLRDSRKKNHYLIQKHNLIRIKYNNKTKYTFFTTRPEWVERQSEGPVKFLLLAEHQPEESYLTGLAEEQRKSELINWSGIY
jgi:hypothetical protein